MMKFLKNEQGIYLVEILVTIAIIGIVTALAIPRFSSYNNHMEAENAVNVITAALKNAQAKAIAGERHKVVFDNTTDPDKLYVASNSVIDLLNPPVGKDVDVIILKGIDLYVSSEVYFDTDGTVMIPGDEIEVKFNSVNDSTIKYDVKVKKNGSIEVLQM